jgi:predicted secreted protein
MFEDCRSKKIVLVSHCYLNQNAISDGTADGECLIKEFIDLLHENRIGIIQMPCPELLCLGLDRGDRQGRTRPVVVENSRIRNRLSDLSSKKKIREIVNQLVYQIDQYIKHDFKVLGVIGVNRSPSCGVETTSARNEEVEGKGIFIQELYTELQKRNIKLFWMGMKTSNLNESLARLNDKIKQFG